MCLACIDYIKGLLTNDEYKRNKEELGGEHDVTAEFCSELEDAIEGIKND